MLELQGDLPKAAALYRQAIALRPNFILAHNSLGSLFKRQDKLDEALAAYQQAVALVPNDAEIHNSLGNILKDQGKFDLALASFDRALSLDPTLGTAHLSRVELKTFQPDDADLQLLESLASNPGSLPEQQLLAIYFALGKALEDVGDYPRL